MIGFCIMGRLQWTLLLYEKITSILSTDMFRMKPVTTLTQLIAKSWYHWFCFVECILLPFVMRSLWSLSTSSLEDYGRCIPILSLFIFYLSYLWYVCFFRQHWCILFLVHGDYVCVAVGIEFGFPIAIHEHSLSSGLSAMDSNVARS